MQRETIEFWIDLNLPPAMASWLSADFNVLAKSFKELGFETSEDSYVFKIAASQKNTVIITTKDIDFINLSDAIGEPPKILYLNVGNISNKALKEIVYKSFANILNMFLEKHYPIIEITN